MTTDEALAQINETDYIGRPLYPDSSVARTLATEVISLREELYTQSVENRDRNERYAAGWRAEIAVLTKELAESEKLYDELMQENKSLLQQVREQEETR